MTDEILTSREFMSIKCTKEQVYCIVKYNWRTGILATYTIS